MRAAVWGVMAGVGVMLAAWGTASVFAQRVLPSGGVPGVKQPWSGPVNAQGQFGPSGELVALSFDLGGGRQQVTLIDPRTHMMSVYHLDPATGEIQLRSVRNVHWDLQMDEFNGTNPSPGEIRSLLGRK